MAFDNIHVGDFGWVAKLGIVQDGVAVDISSYPTRTFVWSRLDGPEIEKTATFDSDGTDGYLVYTVEDGLIDATGGWKVWAQVVKAGAEITSDPVWFTVKERGR